MKGKTIMKRAISTLIAVVMVISCMSASFSFFAEAASWKFVEGVSYKPVNIYVYKGAKVMESGKTYRFGVNANNAVLTVSSSGALSLTTPSSPNRSQPNYYTSNDGSDVLYTTTDYYTEADSGSDFVWSNNTLRNPDTGKYLSYSSATALTMSDTSVTWNNDDYDIKRSINSAQRYVINSNGEVMLSTDTSNSYIFFYEKVTVYQKTSADTEGYYKYDGQTNFTVMKGSTFSDSAIRNQIRVLYKPNESTPDSECQTFTINDDEITLTWNETVDTSKLGDYTATVYACGVALDTITVSVSEDTNVYVKANDPSTSSIENYFDGTSEDDGMIKGDKSVQYGDDLYDAFSDYDSDEFSVTLSAMGQSYPIRTVESIETQEQTHPDVVFVLDVSSSMINEYMNGDSTSVKRSEGMAIALNTAINELMEADPETRFGIVNFGNCYYPEQITLPIDNYSLDEGNTDYITYGKNTSTTQIDVPDATPITDGTAQFSDSVYIFLDGTEASEENNTAKERLLVDINGNVVYYPANSTTSAGECKIENNTYSFVTFGGTEYTILRTGSRYYVYTGVEHKTQTSSSGTGETHTKTVTTVSTDSSNKTTVTLDNGVSFYVYRTQSGYSSNRVYTFNFYNNSSDSTAATTVSSSSTSTTYTRNNVEYTITYVSNTSFTISYEDVTIVPHEKTVTSVSTSSSSKTTVTLDNGVNFYVYRTQSGYSSNRVYTFNFYNNSSDTSAATTVSSSNKSTTYTRDNVEYTITYVSNTSFTVTYNEYVKSEGEEISVEVAANTKKMTVPVLTSGTANRIQTSSLLKNSSGTTMAASGFTFQSGTNGTYTQAGLIAAQKMFEAVENKEKRIPVIVLISDGAPTYFDNDWENVPYYLTTGTSQAGDGTTGRGGTGSNGTNNMAYLAIRTAMSVKSKVTAMYPDQDALFYSIGPGVNFLFGQTCLDPSTENLALCEGDTTTNSQAGRGTPDGLRTELLTNLTEEELNFVSFADWSALGEMTTEELSEAFTHIVTNISDIKRPITVSNVTVSGDNALDNGAYAVFTDTIGDGMRVNGAPVVRYADKNYTSTSSSTKTLEDGSKVVTYVYNHRVTETSTDLDRNLVDLVINITTSPTGKRVVKWYIPSTLLPVVYPNVKDDPITYNLTSPIRLIYKVGLTDESKIKSGTYYTNSVDEPATFSFTATEGNPYYFNNVYDEYGVVQSTTFDYEGETTNKSKNVTDTLEFSSKASAGNDHNIVLLLGNNGYIQLDFTQISVKKIWDDNNNSAGIRPDSISFTIYRDGTQFGSVRTFSKDDCDITKDEQGRDVWEITIDGIPTDNTSTYTVGEVAVTGYVTTSTQNPDGSYTFVNKIDSAVLSYELYLVDENGNPVTEDGTSTTFASRTVVGDRVGVAMSTSSKTIDIDELEAILPKGYYIYNKSASFTETYNGSGNGSATISDSTGTTKVFFPLGATTGNDGTVTGVTDYTDIKVTFAVVKIRLVPDVVVLDYGKTILSDPLANDTGISSYKFDGILGSAPKAGENTKESIKLTNGTAKIERTSGSTSYVVPIGSLVINPFTLSEATYIYPLDYEVSTTNDTSALRYYITSSGVLTKYAAGSNTATDIGTLESEGYLIDGNYLFYRSANNEISAVTGYSFTETTIEEEAPASEGGDGEGYYTKEGTVTVASNVAVTGTGRTNQSNIATLADGTTITGYAYRGSVYFKDSTSTTIYSLTSTGSNTLSYSVEHTLSGMVDKNGNAITVTYTVSRETTSSTSVTVTCDGLKFVSTGGGSTEPIITVIKTLNVHTITITAESGVVYTPFKYMSSIDKVYYYVSPIGTSNNTSSTNEEMLYSTISYIPATSVYYEDDFGGSAENGGLYIEYTGDWYTVDDEGNQSSGVSVGTNANDKQDRGEVGQGNTPYGYDSTYDNCIKFSNGSASKVTGTVSLDPTTKKPTFNATAQFTFTGTGFDVISRTDLDCGMITVYVTDENGKSVNMPVINKGTGTLYQIPVISFMCEDYFDNAYGTYTVKINVNAPSAVLNITGSVFYLDAIRIYNPMGNTADDNAEFDEANAAYNADHEANEYIASIRDYILQAGKLDETEQYGAVYVDTINNEYSGSGMLDDDDYDKDNPSEEKKGTSGMDVLNYRVLNQSLIKDFELIGPNEEVYLSPGYGVGFILETTKQPASVQLEMKIPAPIQTGASLSVYTFGKTSNIGKIDINSAAEMFYDITDEVIFTQTDGVYRAVVVLENGLPSTNAGEIVSITNLKLTYDDDVVALDAADEDSLFTLDGVDEENVALTSLKASWNTYEDVFDSVYTHKEASTPNYEITDIDTVDKTQSGKIVTATVKTSKYVDDLIIMTPRGNVVSPISVTSTVDESKVLTDEYKQAKTWVIKFPVYGTDDTTVEYTIESTNGTGGISTMEFEIDNVKVSKIEVYNKPKTSYKVGESFDSTGMTLKVTYVDGTEKIISSGYATENVTFAKAGKQNVNVSFGGKTTTVKVTVTQTFVQAVKSFFAALARFKFSK